jgi:monofunctional biosynthetic peptidoglycan transglycosylase
MTMKSELAICAYQAARAGTIIILVSIVVFVCFFIVVLGIFRFVDPPTSAVMLRNRIAGTYVQYRWRPIEHISPNLVRSVIGSEDARFCSHYGVDWHEIGAAIEAADRNGINSVRGASTITMQVAKNLFLWTGRSLARKGLELAITPLIELMWPKRRIMEVYLNIAQWGPGVFGANVAAQYHFNTNAIDLTPWQASLLTATLPAPSVRNAGRATRFTRRIAQRILKSMRPGHLAVQCVLAQ